MKSKRYFVAAIAVFIFIQLFMFIWHGHLLKETYNSTSSLWRSQAEMKEMYHWVLINTGLISLLVTYIYSKVITAKDVMTGIRFGTLLGLFIGLMDSNAYSYMPISKQLAMLWFFGGVVQGIGIGVVLSLVYKKR